MSCPVCGGPLTPDPGDTRHVQVPVTSDYGVHAHVDEGIAPLIEACWSFGIATTESCQGTPTEMAHIGFPAGGYAERFASAATLATFEEIEALPDSALDWRIYAAADDEPGAWRWLPSFPWRPGWGAYFPPSDIPELTRRLGRFG